MPYDENTKLDYLVCFKGHIVINGRSNGLKMCKVTMRAVARVAARVGRNRGRKRGRKRQGQREERRRGGRDG